MTLKIFTDLHHGDLFHSLQLLFEDRLGHELYRPIGLNWFHEGYWKIGDPYPNPIDTARQYLDIRPGGWKMYVNINGDPRKKDGVHYIKNPVSDREERAVTLEQFKLMKFDIIMPTFPGHDLPFEKLRNLFQPKAKLIMQMGNFGQTTHLPNVLHSNFYVPRQGQHSLYYHQEINPNLFKFVSPSMQGSNIYSVVNAAPYLDQFQLYQSRLPDRNWKYYGAGSPDGPLSGAPAVAAKMKEAHIAWHLKPMGGVGHSTKGWFAVGRPIVTNMSEHRRAGGDALKLFEPGITCLDLDSHSVQENERKIKELLKPEVNSAWCQRVRRRFDDVINYDRIEQQVKVFLDNLR